MLDKPKKPRVSKSDIEDAFYAAWPRLCILNGIQPVDPVREYKFCPGRQWRFDFSWPRQLVAVEIEGGLWTGGRHNTGAGMLKDMDKYNTAATLGWYVLRFSRQHIEQEPQEMFEQIVACMNIWRSNIAAAAAAGEGDG